ncbi:hypothetical protein HYH02_012643 [Chlamydomonas schloesseri]|uniref:Guanylate cyclase domain-containing protein n=1 Tax=Chlamydomonas schloesseri TaxID=2026947 RepID=A0A835VZE0_9CHLO|nr:hypothetical protein HYH02_012643 [Chlamydomonas schloesseri]|eukprot:KAG2433525.1 hypothetical protein HYH02_012643 [Chlamydomonas schloesseri]
MRRLNLALLALLLVAALSARAEHLSGGQSLCNFSDAGQCTASLVKSVLENFASAGLVVASAVNASAEIASAVSSFTSACLGVQNVLRAVRFLTPAANDEVLAAQGQAFTRATGFRAEFSALPISRIAEEVAFQLQTNVSLYDAWILDVQSAEGAMRARAVSLLDDLVAAATEEQAALLAAAAAKEAARAANAFSASASASASTAANTTAAQAGLARNSTDAAAAANGTAAAGPGGAGGGGDGAVDEVAELRAAAERAGTADEDVHPFYRTHAAAYLGNRTGVVVSGFMPLLYWRRDIFAARLNLTRAPATWGELLEVGRRLHGTDLNGDGTPDPALCWSSPGCSDGGVVFTAVLASLTQRKGSSTGWLLAPDSLAPLAAGPPLRAALQLYGLLGGLEAAPGTSGAAYADGSSCPYVHARFMAGSCAMSITWQTQFKVAQLRFPSLRGRVGVAPLPGSGVVWDREAGAWLSCDGAAAASACPFADIVLPLQLPSLPQPLNGSSSSSAGSGGGTTSSSGSSIGAGGNSSSSGITPVPGSSTSGGGGNRIRVNRAPFMSMAALVGAVDVRTPPEYRTAAFKFFLQLAAPNTSWSQLLDGGSAVGPYRLQHLDPANTQRWLAGGYNDTDLQDFLSSWRYAIEHPNMALPLRLPGAAGLRDALQWAAMQVVGLTPPSGGLAAAPDSTLVAGGGGPVLTAAVDSAVTGLATRLRAALDSAGPLEQTQRIYWRTLNYTPPDATSAPPPSHSGISEGQRITIAAVVTAVGAALCLAAALGGYAWYRRRQAARHRTLFGKMVAPGASPATCLVVTDIVDSTRLWESVPQLAMARAVQTHHDTLRHLLKETGGYESATEGDSFILSFYGAPDAVAFCLRAQAALLACTWPAELLQQELCQPVYAVARSLAPTPTERTRGTVRAALRTPRLPLGGGGGATAATEPNLSFGLHSGTLFGPQAQPPPHSGAGGGVLGYGGRMLRGSTAGVMTGGGAGLSPGDVGSSGAAGGVTVIGVGSVAMAAAAGAGGSAPRPGGASPSTGPGTGLADVPTGGGATMGNLAGLMLTEPQAALWSLGGDPAAGGAASGGGLPSLLLSPMPSMFMLHAQQQQQQQQQQLQRPASAAAGSPTSRWFQPAASAVGTSLRRLQAAMRPGSSAGTPDPQPGSGRSQRAGSSGISSAFAAAAAAAGAPGAGAAVPGGPNSGGGGGAGSPLVGTGTGLSSATSAPQHCLPLLSPSTEPLSSAAAGTDAASPTQLLMHSHSQLQLQMQMHMQRQHSRANSGARQPAPRQASRLNYISNSPRASSTSVVNVQTFNSGGNFLTAGGDAAAGTGGADSPVSRSGGAPSGAAGVVSTGAMAGLRQLIRTMSGLSHTSHFSRTSHAQLQRTAAGSGDTGDHAVLGPAGSGGGAAAASTAGVTPGVGVGLETSSPGGLSPQTSGLGQTTLYTPGEEEAGAAGAPHGGAAATSPIPVPYRASPLAASPSCAVNASSTTGGRHGGGRDATITGTVGSVVSGGGLSGGADTPPYDELGMSPGPSPRATAAAMVTAAGGGGGGGGATSLLDAAAVAGVAMRPLGFHPAAMAAAARGSAAGEMPPSFSMGMAADGSVSSSGAMYGSGAVGGGGGGGPTSSARPLHSSAFALVPLGPQVSAAATAAANATGATAADPGAAAVAPAVASALLSSTASDALRGVSASGGMSHQLPLPPYTAYAHGGGPFVRSDGVGGALTRAEVRLDATGGGNDNTPHSRTIKSRSHTTNLTNPSTAPLPYPGSQTEAPGGGATSATSAGATPIATGHGIGIGMGAVPLAPSDPAAAASGGGAVLPRAQFGMHRTDSDFLRASAMSAAGGSTGGAGAAAAGYDHTMLRGGTADQLMLTTANMAAAFGAAAGTGSSAVSAAFALMTAGQGQGGGGGGGGVMGTLGIMHEAAFDPTAAHPSGASPHSVAGAAYVSRASGAPGGGSGLLPMNFRRCSIQAQAVTGLGLGGGGGAGGGGGGGWSTGLLPSGPVMTGTLDTSGYALQPYAAAGLTAAAAAAAAAAMGPGRSMTLAEYYSQIYKVLPPAAPLPQPSQQQQLQSLPQQPSPHSGTTVSQRSTVPITPVPSPHGWPTGSASAAVVGAGAVVGGPDGSLQQQLQKQQALPPGAVLIFSGLQVRMGVHAGVEPTEVSYNRVAGRTQYSGTALQFAKAVCDAAQGGMVLLSATAHEQLNKAGGGGGGCVPVLLDMGSHVVKMRSEPLQLYMAASRDLMARVPALGPVRSREQLAAGVLAAPLGCVALGVLLVAGLPTLQAWDKAVTEEALETFRRVVVTVALRQLGGQVVEEAPGRVLAAFGSAAAAVRWAASCEALLKAADWSEALLGHELCEEVAGPVLLDSNMEGPVVSAHDDVARCLFRGLRVRGAVDVARVKAELLPATGRLAYRGALASNVGRIAAYVSAGQVVCTGRAWRCYQAAAELAEITEAAAAAAAAVAGGSGLACAGSGLPPPLPVLGASLGLHSIRGVGDKLELWSLRLGGSAVEYFESMSVMGTMQRDEIAAAAAQGLLGPGRGGAGAGAGGAVAGADLQAQLVMMTQQALESAASAGMSVAGGGRRTPAGLTMPGVVGMGVGARVGMGGDTGSTALLMSAAPLQPAGSGPGLGSGLGLPSGAGPVAWEVAPEELRGMMVE